MIIFDFVNQAIEVSSEIKESVDVAPKEAGVSEVPQLAVASAKQTETQASAVVGETLSGTTLEKTSLIAKDSTIYLCISRECSSLEHPRRRCLLCLGHICV